MRIADLYKTEEEVAKELGVEPWKLRYLRKTGLLPSQKIGSTTVYSEIERKIAKLLIEEKV